MKTNISLFMATASIIASCSEKDVTKTTNKKMLYVKSLNKWTELKKQNGNSYQYQVNQGSWSGHGNLTELTIKNGIVVQRTCKAYKTDGKTGVKKIKFSYSENEQEIGNNKWGALPRTIDQLYNSCIEKYLIVDTAKNTVHFETKNDGIISLCGFIPNNCIDDCYEGITITSFKWIK